MNFSSVLKVIKFVFWGAALGLLCFLGLIAILLNRRDELPTSDVETQTMRNACAERCIREFPEEYLFGSIVDDGRCGCVVDPGRQQ